MRAHRLARFQMDRDEETGFGKDLFPGLCAFERAARSGQQRTCPVTILYAGPGEYKKVGGCHAAMG